MVRIVTARHLKTLRQKNMELKGRLQAMQMVLEYKDTMINELSHRLDRLAIELEESIEKRDCAEYERKMYEKVIDRAIKRHSALSELLEDLHHEQNSQE